MTNSRRLDAVFWYSAASPYMVDRFSALAARGNLRFEVWFNRERNPGRSWVVDWGYCRFPYSFVSELGGAKRRVGIPIREYRRAQPRVLLTFHADLGVAPSVLVGPTRSTALVYYVERTFDAWTERTRAKECIKGLLFRNADGFATPGRDADGYIKRYVGDKPIFRLRHVLRTSHFAQSAALRRAPSTRAFRLDHGLDGFVFMYVGRLVREKGVGTLLEAFARLRRSGANCSLVIVGDGSEEERYRRLARERGIGPVVFEDFVQQDKLPKMLALADAFVFPTWGDPYGIVVDEAMASGLPVVSTTSAGEIRDRVIDGRTGYLVTPQNAESLANGMALLMSSPKSASSMGWRAMKHVDARTLDSWCDEAEYMVGSLR